MRGDMNDVKQLLMFKNAKYKNLGENLYNKKKLAVNITPHIPDDGSVEPKRYCVDFLINLFFHLDYLVISFSTHTHTHTYIYIYASVYVCVYIYIYICVCV